MTRLYYYLYYNDDGEVIGYVETPVMREYHNSKLVTKEEYISAGGIVIEEPSVEKKPTDHEILMTLLGVNE